MIEFIDAVISPGSFGESKCIKILTFGMSIFRDSEFLYQPKKLRKKDAFLKKILYRIAEKKLREVSCSLSALRFLCSAVV